MQNNELLQQIITQFEELKDRYKTEGHEVDDSDLEKLLSESFNELQGELMEDSTKFKINYQKLNSDATDPKYAYNLDSGFDFHSTEEILIPSFGRALVPTGLKIEIPEGLELQVRPKSGLAIKQGLTVLNTPGTVDCGYLGEIKVILFNTSNTEVLIEKGMKIAQGVFSPVMSGKYVNLTQVNNIQNTERGDNGFGSTGIK